MKTAEDKLILRGHEFTSRFILGSGKFSLELVKACIEKADAQIITLACQHPGLYPGKCHTSAEYVRSKNCRGGSANRKTFKRSRMRRFC